MIVKSKSFPMNCLTCKAGKDKKKFKPENGITFKDLVICGTCHKVLQWTDEKVAQKEEKKKSKQIEFSEDEIEKAQEENPNKEKNVNGVQTKFGF